MLRKAGITAAMLLFALPATAEETATYLIKLHVPVSCSVDFVPSSGMAGQLSEYCNAPAGYEVRVLYMPEDTKGMTLDIDGQRFALDGSGDTLINSAPGASIRRVNVAVEGGDGNAAPISFMIVPRMI